MDWKSRLQPIERSLAVNILVLMSFQSIREVIPLKEKDGNLLSGWKLIHEHSMNDNSSEFSSGIVHGIAHISQATIWQEKDFTFEREFLSDAIACGEPCDCLVFLKGNHGVLVSCRLLPPHPKVTVFDWEVVWQETPGCVQSWQVITLPHNSLLSSQDEN
jgi:hypothetical protein